MHALNQIVDRTIHVSLLNDTSTDSIPVLTLTAAGTTPTEEEAAAEEAISIAPIQTMGNRDYPSLNIDPSVPLPALVYGKQRLHTVFELIRIGKCVLVVVVVFVIYLVSEPYSTRIVHIHCQCCC